MQSLPKKIAIILDDASYLIDEMEALSLVIKAIPITERPAGSYSVLEYIGAIDYAQKTYYHEIIRLSISEKNIDVKSHNSTFNPDLVSKEASEVIESLIQNRNELVSFLKSLQEIHWETSFTLNSENTTILELLTEMIQFERATLREIADRVLAIDQKNANQRP